MIDSFTSGNEDFDFRGGWNFGPDVDSFVSVGEVTTAAMKIWGASGTWVADSTVKPHEAQLLSLDSTRANTGLGWSNLLGLDQALAWTLNWYREIDSGVSARGATLRQIEEFQLGI